MNCALVTGGSRGIGKAISLQLAKDHGLHIIINYSSDQQAAKTVLKEIEAGGGTAELLQFKVQDKSSVNDVLSKWEKDNPGKSISVLVNNAGVAEDSLFIWLTEEKWDDVINVSLKGMYNVSQAVVPLMMRQKFGRIVNISSVSGLKGAAGQVNYSAAKAGMIGATKALAQELASMGITVNAVAPGFIKTEMTSDVHIQPYLKLIPVGRMGEPDEVAGLVSFLASDNASYITGEVISVNGGLYS